MRGLDVGVNVGVRVEPTADKPQASVNGVALELLGPLVIVRGSVSVVLPASRKLRGLLGYLALCAHPVPRPRLCELLWDTPSDPRGELRWCLTRLRTALDDCERKRVRTNGDSVWLDLADCQLDVRQVEASFTQGLGTLPLPALLSLYDHFKGDFLNGLEIEHCPLFNHWLLAQRRHWRSLQLEVLAQLVERCEPDTNDADKWLTEWLELAPLDLRAHSALLTRLASRGQFIEGDEHVHSAARLFVHEDVGIGPMRELWRQLRATPHSDLASPPAHADVAPNGVDVPYRRASLAVMPFLVEGGSAIRGGIADGLTHDIITRLAKLRHLFIIARGSVFALAEQRLAPVEAGRRLNVDYVASGSLRDHGRLLAVQVDVVEVKTARIIWSDTFEHARDDTLAVLDDIGDQIVAAVTREVETVEQQCAVLKAPNALNAWEAYHRGLWHMYRFTKDENALAQQFFLTSLRLDPTFARAHAGLSFTHWQNSFQRWEDHDAQTELALRSAMQSLQADKYCPAAHWAMGRALWLDDQQDECLKELGSCVALSPNFALGHYTLAFVHAQSGDPVLAIEASNQSRHLSPFDPLLFGMLAARGLAHIRLGEFAEATEWALRAAAQPNAHIAIHAVAVHCLALVGRLDEAQQRAAAVRRLQPGYGCDDFLRTFRFEPEAAALFRQAGQRIGWA